MSDVTPLNTPKTPPHDNYKFQLWGLIFARCNTPNLPDEPTLADGPPSELRIDALNTSRQKLADEPTLADGPLWVIEQRWLEYQYTKIGRWIYFGQWTSHSKLRIDDLNIATLNLADEPTLANGPPSTNI